jgi:uncharacterized protein with GYD domain
MPTYISLLRYTQKGIEHIKQSPSRLDAAKKIFRDAGGELKTFYLTTGRIDAVAIFEAPNDESAARLTLTLGAHGNIRTETLRAFPEEEYRKIIAALP